eukprot:110133-Prymnesium_polylepis.1
MAPESASRAPQQLPEPCALSLQPSPSDLCGLPLGRCHRRARTAVSTFTWNPRRTVPSCTTRCYRRLVTLASTRRS